MLEVGTPSPKLTVRDDTGKAVKLADLERPLVVFFYPKASTPG
jgi:peroxiredoxin